MTDLSYEFAKLIAEALGLSPDEFFKMFYNNGEHMHHRIKLMKYPAVAEGQGIGAHHDLSFLSFVRISLSDL
jgi:isopenicillin N synthase-like dioxygenase